MTGLFRDNNLGARPQTRAVKAGAGVINTLAGRKIACFTNRACICSRAGKPDVELVLNLVWVLLALLSFGLWLAYGRSPAHKHRHFSAIIALICVAGFLFPVISMSDDLLSSPALCESSKVKKWCGADAVKALFFVRALPVLAGPALGTACLHSQVSHSSLELVWSNLDRRPPPLQS